MEAEGNMDNLNWYVDVLKKYAVFSGRARRKEYWMFFLFNCIVSFVIGFVFGFIGRILGVGLSSPIMSIYTLAVLTPGIAVAIRRMHDTGRSGWYVLVPLLNLVYLCQDSEPGENAYGPNPKGTGPALARPAFRSAQAG
jgi:uncharacterized membrane protein YhaH (DUF805 family)